MIFVTLYRRKKVKSGFSIKGHANFDKEGLDIVCAAVSMLAYTTINSLDYYNIDIDFEDDGNTMTLYINDFNLESKVLMDNFEIGIKTLLTSYSEYVNLKYEEV